MAEDGRLEELRRRVQLDPASIAFAVLAEEYRRAGRYAEALEVCRAGLDRHPAYLSARVTLGRVLMETGEYEAARAELDGVLRSAPENLAAIRALAEIHQRLGESTESLSLIEMTARATTPPTDATIPVPMPAPPRDVRPRLERQTPTAAVVARLERFLAAIDAARHA